MCRAVTPVKLTNANVSHTGAIVSLPEGTDKLTGPTDAFPIGSDDFPKPNGSFPAPSEDLAARGAGLPGGRDRLPGGKDKCFVTTKLARLWRGLPASGGNTKFAKAAECSTPYTTREQALNRRSTNDP